MKRRVIVSIYDDRLSIGRAIKLLDAVGLDKINYLKNGNEADGGWKHGCLCEMSDGHIVNVDTEKNKGSIKFDIWSKRND